MAPGVIKTPMHRPETLASLAALHPLGRFGQIQEIVDAVLYLESATFVTGETLHVDGGARRPLVTPGGGDHTHRDDPDHPRGEDARAKGALIKGATDLMVDVLNKPQGLTFVVIQSEDGGLGRRRLAGERRPLTDYLRPSGN